MHHPKTVLIVGTGMFGRHYVRILSRLADSIPPKPSEITQVILTRTSRRMARETAANLKKDLAKRAIFIGEKVDSEDTLTTILDRYRPELTCIVAKDPNLGNRIHARYSGLALAAGSAVLCEKPFSEADGSGSSLMAANRLARYGATGRFGLELPFAAVQKQMQTSLHWESRFLEFKRIDFFWGTQTPIQTNLFNELALHPWSLIPDGWSTKALRTRIRANTASVAGILQHDKLSRSVDFRIHLSRANRFRGFQADSRCFGFRMAGTTVELIQLDVSIEEAAPMDPGGWPGRMLLLSENPLRQNIIASLRHEPITGVRRTITSQSFLEKIQGYLP